ncbi:MAG: citramalate synthase [Clostridium sp.]|jgi:2-isopropylmalate synthase|nr:citramalate synthase [Clostridium sp.]
MKIHVLDSTLRDGAQAENISFSVNDKLAIARALDEYGVGYIEAGNPASNPKDLEFFQKAGELKLTSALLTAFGSTCRKGVSAEEDANLQAILKAQTPAVAIFGKASMLHVKEILETTPEENLRMVTDSVAYLKKQGKELIFDAEHFFDGYREDSEYAMQVLRAALNAGADVLCLCDTNGGTLPAELQEVTARVVRLFPGAVMGIHAHNDCGCAVANTLLAVQAGARHIQGTFVGFGERCGNADLSSILPALALKAGFELDGDVKLLCETAGQLAELANIHLPAGKPFVGRSAFSHKAGMHIDGVVKRSSSFEHIDPESVGNRRRFLMSEVAGRGSVLQKILPIAPSLTKTDPRLTELTNELKKMEHYGYQFEAADASFELLARKVLGMYEPHFRVALYKTIGEYPAPEGEKPATAVIKVEVDGKTEATAALGSGPVNALDIALRKALCVFFPQLGKMQLTDYKVRVLDQESATAAKVRVLIESGDGTRTWTTIGVSDDIIQASLIALVDSIEYKLSRGD